MLSYSFKQRETVGFVKGTPTSDMALCLDKLRTCAAHVGYPLLLPTLLLSSALTPTAEARQRDAREWLRKIEHGLAIDFGWAGGLRQINQSLVECYAQVMWQSAPAWRKIINRLEAAAKCFWDHLGDDEKTDEMRRFHAMILERLDFHKARLDGVENYGSNTMKRLEQQRAAVSGKHMVGDIERVHINQGGLPSIRYHSLRPRSPNKTRS
jgi:hypothetical protein